MSNDEAKDRLENVLSLFDEQMKDFATVTQKQASLTGVGTAADGSIEITVNGQQMITKTVIDESYLDDHEIAELGDHVTEAAQAASRDVRQKWSNLMEPMNRRREQMSGMTAGTSGVPGYQSMLDQLKSLTEPPREQPATVGNEVSRFPTVKE
jgi:DNA-binding protein YbaB